MERHELKGKHASKGYSCGELLILQPPQRQINKDRIKEDKIDSELLKLEKAIDKTLIEIFDLKNDLKDRLTRKESLIFDAYQSILEDKYFIKEIKEIIAGQKLNAEYAVEICIQNYIKLIEDSNNEYVKQRIHDLNDIKTRIILNLESKGKKVAVIGAKGRIIVVEELTPSIASMLCNKEILGVAAQKGAGYLSHSAIILRGLGIPAVNEINFEELKDYNESLAIIDGDEGLLLVNPNSDEVVNYLDKLIEDAENQRELSNRKESVTVTKDGHIVALHANISNLNDYRQTLKLGIGGIGLVRTELLFFNSKRIPSEKEQIYIYSRIAKKMQKYPVVIRTVDIGDDKFPVSVSDSEKDAYQSLRGLARSLALEEQLKTQIRSIIRSNYHNNLSITFPMVNNHKEIIEVKKLIKIAEKEIRKEGIKSKSKLKIGVIIETNSAVKNIRKILSRVDFISIGTNDLFGQVMNISRENTEGKKCEYCDPRFLNIIKFCINESVRKRKPVSVCGEMAADPMSAILLLGMGVNMLSISPSKYLNIHKTIGKINFEEAKKMAEMTLKCESAEDVRNILAKWDS